MSLKILEFNDTVELHFYKNELLPYNRVVLSKDEWRVLIEKIGGTTNEICTPDGFKKKRNKNN